MDVLQQGLGNVNGLIAIGAGLAIAGGTIGGGIGQGLAAAKALEGISRNPGALKDIRSNLILSLGIIESNGIYGFIIAAILIFLKMS